MARYTVKQLAKLSGVSVRTLHYYDEIGLLAPADIGTNGYRYYDRPQALRLQQIMFYRELGLPLAEIARTLDDPGFDMTEALKAHRHRLAADITRYRRLIRTIDDTLIELTGDTDMPTPLKNPYKGFDPEQQKAYEAELVARHGDKVRARIAESHAKLGNMTDTQQQALQDEAHAINEQVLACINAGNTPADDEVQALTARHYAWVSAHWTPDAKSYAGLGRMYVEDQRFRAFYDRYDIRLVDFLAEAMQIYADASLT